MRRLNSNGKTIQRSFQRVRRRARALIVCDHIYGYLSLVKRAYEFDVDRWANMDS
jgi:hypothetical protein